MGRVGIDELKYIYTLQQAVIQLNYFKKVLPETLEKLEEEEKETKEILKIK